jgi:hypothetical protein
MLAVIVTDLLSCHFRVDFGPNRKQRHEKIDTESDIKLLFAFAMRSEKDIL